MRNCITGSGLHDELAWLVKAGLIPLQTLRAATVNAARYFGRLEDFGSVRRTSPVYLRNSPA